MTREKTVLDILKEARELISDPRDWTVGCYAHNDRGDDVEPTDTSACQWCARGALCVAADITVEELEFSEERNSPQKARNLLDRCAEEISGYGIVHVNDHTDHPTVMKAFDCAISKASP